MRLESLKLKSLMYTNLEYIPQTGAKKLIVMLHGIGSNGEDLMSLQPFISHEITDTAFYSPNAIEPFDGGMGGYQWFSKERIFDANFLDYTAENCQIALQMIDAKIKELNLKRSDTILLGFSQGSIIIPSILSMDEGDDNFAGAILFAGRYMKPQRVISNKYNLCIIHSEEDDIMSMEDAQTLYNNLKEECSNQITLHYLPNLGHSIDHRGIEIAVQFIQDNFK